MILPECQWPGRIRSHPKDDMAYSSSTFFTLRGKRASTDREVIMDKNGIDEVYKQAELLCRLNENAIISARTFKLVNLYKPSFGYNLIRGK